MFALDIFPGVVIGGLLAVIAMATANITVLVDRASVERIRSFRSTGRDLFSYVTAKMCEIPVLVVGDYVRVSGVARAMLLLILAIRRNWRQFS